MVPDTTALGGVAVGTVAAETMFHSSVALGAAAVGAVAAETIGPAPATVALSPAALGAVAGGSVVSVWFAVLFGAG